LDGPPWVIAGAVGTSTGVGAVVCTTMIVRPHPPGAAHRIRTPVTLTCIPESVKVGLCRLFVGWWACCSILPSLDRCRIPGADRPGQGPRAVWPRSGAGGVLDAAGRTRMIRGGGEGRRWVGSSRWRSGGWDTSGGRRGCCRRVGLRGCGRVAARLTYGRQARRRVPADRMIDRVSPRLLGVRPLSLIGPSAAPNQSAVARSDKCVAGTGRCGYAPS
jgi:hypothetical protein